MSAAGQDVYLGIGSNLGDRAGHLDSACEAIRVRIGRVLARSSTYETEPWGGAGASSPRYLNEVVRVCSRLRAEEVLAEALAIEHDHGRARPAANAPRTLDIDVLFYGQQIVAHPDLRIPHPRLHERRFVLEPLLELAPEFIHPGLGLTVRELRDRCRDSKSVRRIG